MLIQNHSRGFNFFFKDPLENNLTLRHSNNWQKIGFRLSVKEMCIAFSKILRIKAAFQSLIKTNSLFLNYEPELQVKHIEFSEQLKPKSQMQVINCSTLWRIEAYRLMFPRRLNIRNIIHNFGRYDSRLFFLTPASFQNKFSFYTRRACQTFPLIAKWFTLIKRLGCVYFKMQICSVYVATYKSASSTCIHFIKKTQLNDQSFRGNMLF